MKKLLLSKFFMLFLMLSSAVVVAQETITGTITEASTGNPLPGANIIIKGTTTGTTSDFDGNFSLTVFFKIL